MKPLPKELSKLWKETEDHPDKYILRLSLMRDLSRLVHAERSMDLAQGKIPQGQTLERMEAQLSAVRGHPDIVTRGTLEETLEAPVSLEATQAKIPTELAALIPRAKLERYDRHWEAFLATEAFRQGWSIWELDATLLVSKAEAFHKHLSQVLWPKGVILYVEMGADKNLPAGEGANLWNGRWLLIAHSSLKPEHLEIERSPGVFRETPISSPTWRRLFPASGR